MRRENTLISGVDRPLRLWKRRDLQVRQHTYHGRRSWVVKDPLTQQYYRFEEEEYALLSMLDGQASLLELQRRFEREFAPQKISVGELHHLVGMVHRNALAVAEVAGQGDELLKRHRMKQRQKRLSAFTNVLAIRFKGIDPDRLLKWLDPWFGWLFAPIWCAISLLLGITALLLVTLQFDVFHARLPAFHEFFATGNWLWLAATLAITKMLHEFGHGIACKRFGGECHEMGVMLLVLTPCLYCNVSDSWMLPSKWKRAAIGAAGMYFELILASLATFVWWFSNPGIVNFLSLNVMFICSVSTLLFNANPLLRYDGYYILSDLVEIPNLRQKATTILQRKAGLWFLGLEETPDPFLPQRRQLLFAVYAIASFFYRWFVVLGILSFLYYVFEPYGFQVVGQAIACVAVYGIAVHPLVRLIKFFRIPGRWDQVKKPRLIWSLSIAATIGLAIFGISFPHYVRCDVVLQPHDAAFAYVESPGAIQRIHVRFGEWVSQGQPLVELTNREVELAVIRLFNERQQLESKLGSLRHRAFDDDGAALEVAEVEESLAAIQGQLEQRQQDFQRLRITAPADGLVLATPTRDQPPGHGQLQNWSGSPLEAKNLDAFLQIGEAVCQIGDPRRLEALLVIDQSDIEFVQPGQRVEIVFESVPGHRFRSQLQQLSQLELQLTPESLSSEAGGNVVTRTDAVGGERPLSTSYQASALLDDERGSLLVGTTGKARIFAGQHTLAQRAWRFLCQTF
jgi:putative peptide zinc metalloprotease protein